MNTIGNKCGSIFDSIKNQIYNTKKYNLHELLSYDNKDILELSIDIMNIDQKKIYQNITNLYEGQSSDATATHTIFAIEGLPGTGKSFLQDVLHGYFLLQQVKNKSLSVEVVAPTNYIALQQRGITLNRAVGEFCSNKLKVQNFKLDENVMDLFKKNLINVNAETSLTDLVKNIQLLASFVKKRFSRNENKQYIILIDECSMISSLSFAILLASYPPQSNCTFIMFLGCNQLPPVSPELNLKCCFNVDWGFEYQKNVYTLQTQMRFNDESQSIFREYVSYVNDHLNNVKLDKKTLFAKTEYFFKNLEIGGSLEDYHTSKQDDKILIVATNKKRNTENHNRLKMYDEIFEIPAIINEKIPPSFDVYTNLGIDKVLKIAPGALCIFKANLLNIGLVKGMVVTVLEVGVNPDTNEVNDITVKEIDSGKRRVITRHGFETQYSGKLVFQFPITLGYAITAHCAQGKTLTSIVGVDLDTSYSWSLIKNLFFVAITRVQFSNQLFMNKHPAFWPFPPELELNSLEQVKEYLFSTSSPPPKRFKKDEEEKVTKDKEKIFTTNIYDICQEWVNNSVY